MNYPPAEIISPVETVGPSVQVHAGVWTDDHRRSGSPFDDASAASVPVGLIPKSGPSQRGNAISTRASCIWSARRPLWCLPFL